MERNFAWYQDGFKAKIKILFKSKTFDLSKENDTCLNRKTTVLIFDYSTEDWTNPWLCFKTKRSSFDEWGFYRQNYIGEVDLKVLKKNHRIAMKKPN